MATFRCTEETFEIIDRAFREHRESVNKPIQPIDKRTSAIARAVIVKGLPQAEVARKHEVSKQWVNQIVGKYYKLYLTTGASGEKDSELWVRRALEIPAALAASLDRFLPLAKTCKDPKALQKALTAVIRAIEGQSDKLE